MCSSVCYHSTAALATISPVTPVPPASCCPTWLLHHLAVASLSLSAAVSEKHLVKVVAQLAEPLGLVLEFAEGQPIAEKPNLQVCLRLHVWCCGSVLTCRGVCVWR